MEVKRPYESVYTNIQLEEANVVRAPLWRALMLSCSPPALMLSY